MTNTHTRTDLYERIAAVVREALPGEPGDRLLDRIATELAAAAGFDPAEDEALYARFQLEAERVAATDTVTGLPNRARVAEDLARAIATARRYDEPVTVLVAQLDDVSREHEERVAGEALLRLVRVSDVVGRIGPGRFAIVLPRTGALGAALVAGRIAELEDFAFSFGNATLSNDVGSAGELLATAEATLGDS